MIAHRIGLVLVSTLLAGCSAKLVYGDSAGLRYRVQRLAKVKAVVVEWRELGGGGYGPQIVARHAPEARVVPVVDESADHLVGFRGGLLASYTLTVDFNENGTLKDVLIASESELAEALSEAAKGLTGAPELATTFRTLDQQRDARKKAEIDAEIALQEARFRQLGASRAQDLAEQELRVKELEVEKKIAAEELALAMQVRAATEDQQATPTRTAVEALEAQKRVTDAQAQLLNAQRELLEAEQKLEELKAKADGEEAP